ncbi:MAG TPA: M23 family metallopeptidase [Nevskiaceae bacterium]|nr:M23 family metallopeptidase [Nevskiaceae bacterium]
MRRLALLLILGTSLAQASEPRLRGSWQQGGVIIGEVAPGSAVSFNGRALAVSREGAFVLGLAVDEAPAAELTVQAPGQPPQRYEYPVQARAYDEQRISGLPEKMVSPPAAAQRQIALDNQRVGAARNRETAAAWFREGFRWPVPATVSGVYGSKRVLNGTPKQPHFGIDLAAPQGTPVLASGAGQVSLARDDLYYTGGTVILDHGQGLSTTYLHLSRLLVKEGETVAAGQVIGEVGATGRATGPHLCWRANWYQTRLDASLLVQDAPARKGQSTR